MVKQWWSAVILALSLSSLAFATYTLMTSRAAHASALRAAAVQTDFVPQPANWVPFSADVQISEPNRGITAVGRFFRDSHGCGRLETGSENDVRVIYIQNMVSVQYYYWTKLKDQWVVGPMKLPRDGWKPIQRRSNLVGLLKRPQLAEVRRGRNYNLHSDTGLTAYTYVNLSGTLSLQIPELNFFEVLKQNLEGRREAYSNIEIGEQPENIFQPPVGASLVTTDLLGGVHVEAPDDAAAHMDKLLKGTSH